MNRVFIHRAAAGLLAATLTAIALPTAPALADGAASTRNIILGGAAATLLIINHNKKVHERYAEDARRQAAAEQDAHNAWLSYQDETSAYNNEVALNRSLQHEVALQHQIVVAQRQQITKEQHQLSMVRSQQPVASRPVTQVAQNDQPSGAGPFMQQTTSMTTARVAASRRAHQRPPQRIAAQAFGWGIF